MLKYKSFTVNPIEENTYLIWDEDTLEAAIVDCGAWIDGERQMIADFISARHLQLHLVLQTHAHFDHIWGVPWLFQTYGLRPLLHLSDETIYYDMPDMVSHFGLHMKEALPRPDSTLQEGGIITLGNSKISVLHTPGHTPGGVCFHLPDEHLLFSGDTLFQGSAGRTDLPGGDMNQLLQSLRRLITLPAETTVLPGHGPHTTIGYEAKYNPFVR